MKTLLVRLVRGGLKLKRCVLDRKMFRQAVLKGVKDLGRMPIVETRVFHHHVG